MSRYPRPADPPPSENVVGRRRKQFARECSLSESYVALKIKDGTLRTAKVGATRIILTDPAEFLAAHEAA